MGYKKIFIVLSCFLVFLSFHGKIFEEAKWIGTPENRQPLNSFYLSVFRINFDLELYSQDTVSFFYGKKDPRLIDGNLNIYNISNPPDSIWIEIKFCGLEDIEIYRLGYHPDDSNEAPIAILKQPNLLKGKNHIEISSNSGITSINVNNKNIGEIVLNPLGRGGDYIAFPILGDLSIDIPKGKNAKINNLYISNFREPSNTIYSVKDIFAETSDIKLPVIGMPQLKTHIKIDDIENLKSAVMKASARGIYDLYINHQLVCEDYFNPGYTQYNKTHLYQSFEILPFLKNGENEVKVLLGEGWWSGPATFMTENWNFFGDRQSFIGELSLEYEDGQTLIYNTTPESWMYTTDGPIISGSFFQGEIYDANKEKDNISWNPAEEIPLDGFVNKLIGNWGNINFLQSFGNKVSITDTLTAISVTSHYPKTFIYDMGQNFAGVPWVRFNDLQPNQQVRLRFSEVLYPELPQYKGKAGTLMTENLRAAMCQDQYIAKGEPSEIFSPRFTLHGYRYIEISGIDEALPLDCVKGLALSSINDLKANYECSDDKINRLWKNIEWSAKSNFISVPIDCPQRNERLGWMGDISVFSPTATKLADISKLLQQYFVAIRDCQTIDGKFPDVAPTGVGFGGLLWGSAGITVPWEYLKAYNDTTVIKEHYLSMKKYIDFIISNLIDSETGIIIQNRDWSDLGDWLSPEYDKNDNSLLWECYFIYDLDIMSKIASIINKNEDSAYFSKLKEDRKTFFIKTYIDKSTGKTIWSDFNPTKRGNLVDTQVSYALPIALEIYNEPKFISNFKNTILRENMADDGSICPPFSLMTGFIGTAWISEALSKINEADIAYNLLLNTSYPSWLYPVTQGATTIWERLNSYTHDKGFGNNNSMNSFNHYSFGSIGNWLLTRSLGINRTENGKIYITPVIDPTGAITWAKGWIDTNDGLIETEWDQQGEKIKIEVKIPEGKEGYLIYNSQAFPLHSSSNIFSLDK